MSVESGSPNSVVCKDDAPTPHALALARLEFVVNSLDTAVFEWNLENGSFYCSEAYQKYAMSEISAADILANRGPTDMVHPDDLPVLLDFFKGTTIGKSHVECIMRLKLRSGGYRWCRMLGFFFRNPQGKPTRTLGIVIDINDEHEPAFRMNAMLNNLPDGVGIFELYGGTGHQVYLNDSFYTLLHDTREHRSSLSDESFFDNTHPDDEPLMRAAVKKLLNGADFTAFDYRSKTGVPGEYLWIHLAAKAISRTAEKVTIYCCFTNIEEMISARRQLELANDKIQAEYRQEQLRRKLLEQDSFVNICIDVTHDRVTSINSEDARYKNAPQNISGHDAVELMLRYVPDEKDKAAVRHLMRSEHARELITSGVSEESLTYRSYQADGALHWIHVSCRITTEPTSGQILAYAYFKDIDEEKTAALASQRAADGFIDYIILVKSKSGIARFVQCRLRSLLPPQCQTVFPLEMAHWDLRNNSEASQKAILEFFRTKWLVDMLSSRSSVSMTLFGKTSCGRTLRKNVYAAYLDSTAEDIVIVGQDTSILYENECRQKEALEKAAQEANKANHAKTEFLSRMSHDMRTPMNGILGLADLSKGETDPGILRAYMDKIRTSGRYLLALINDMLDLQKIESGDLVLDFQTVSIKDFLDSIGSLIRIPAQEKGILFRVTNKNADPLTFIRADPMRLQQIFSILLSNAVKFTPSGGEVSLDLEILHTDGITTRILMTVTDNGIGMSSEFLENSIFKPFSRENNEYTPESVGSGLGLSSAKHRVEQMGGVISVESCKGAGSRFFVTLDFDIVNADAVSATVTADKEATTSHIAQLSGCRILLAEDNPLNAEVAQAILAEAGCIVTSAENGQVCVDTFSKSPLHYFDAVLMDIRMPVMDGLDAARAIRALPRVDANDTPIIALTANAYAEDIQNCLNAGMNTHLAKPINIPLLYKTIASLLVHNA